MAVVIRLRQAHLDDMIAHALEDAPIECCGLLANRDGALATVYRARNKEASPYRFSIEGLDQVRIERAMDDAGEELSGFYHSHTGSEARPSPTDIRSMGPLFGPPYVHFVIGVADPEHPVARVFTIEDGAATEHEYEVVAD
ncbi:MAG TPA: M67 family metallopeptidase [Tepidiformaceae bacterium]|nr:M67 family metallopeptidase [Tepidiformaceae bacterium]